MRYHLPVNDNTYLRYLGRGRQVQAGTKFLACELADKQAVSVYGEAEMFQREGL